MPEPGELLCGAWLRYVGKCDFVIYNHTDESMQQGEVDVIGVRGSGTGGLPPKVYACEVSDHLHGFNYGRGKDDTIEKLRKKFTRANDVLGRTFAAIADREFMFWSVRVNEGKTTAGLALLADEVQRKTGFPLTLVVNDEYGKRVGEVWRQAKLDKRRPLEEGYRWLQILSRVQGGPLDQIQERRLTRRGA